jgi:hypothetical protein
MDPPTVNFVGSLATLYVIVTGIVLNGLLLFLVYKGKLYESQNLFSIATSIGGICA